LLLRFSNAIFHSIAANNGVSEMTQAKHTPGPWFIAYTHEGNTEIAIDDEPGMHGERDYDLVTVTHGDPDELAANAALIAAAPDLLAALQKAVRFGGLFPDLKTEVEAVIAKATGGAA
jgi:hypothetical protein